MFPLRPYKVFGQGTDPCLLAFHGFGQSNSVFEPLSAFYTDGCLISFDIYLDEYPVSAETFAETVEALLDQRGIDEKVSLLAFSLGSYPALALLAYMPHRISNVLMLAPEALAPHWLFRLATHTKLGRSVFRSITQGKMRLGALWAAKQLQRLGIAPALATTTARTLSTPARAKRLWTTWNAYAAQNLDPAHILQAADCLGIKVRLIFGEKDRIVPLSRFRKLQKQLPFAEVSSMPYQHFNLLNAWMAKFR